MEQAGTWPPPPRPAAGLALDCDDAEGDDGETPLAYDIDVFPADLALKTLHARWRSGEIVVPSRARGYAWGLQKASRLIESLMAGIPVPPVYLSTTGEQRCVVVDGMHRLLTIFSYLEGRLPGSARGAGREFRIAGISEDSALFGRTFAELDEEDGRRLAASTLRVVTVVHNDPADWRGAYEVFERLGGRGGAADPSAQEVRARAYGGPLSDLLDDLNGMGEWRDILGMRDPDPRMKDRELILRYMALLHEGDRYERPMKGFLSDFMGAHRDPGGEYLDSERRRFATACRAVAESLGPAPFGGRDGRLRVPLFDSVFVAFAERGAAARPDDILERFQALRADREFGLHAGALSGATGAVLGRLRMARRILFGDPIGHAASGTD